MSYFAFRSIWKIYVVDTLEGNTRNNRNNRNTRDFDRWTFWRKKGDYEEGAGKRNRGNKTASYDYDIL